MQYNERIIIALDFQTLDEVKALVQDFKQTNLLDPSKPNSLHYVKVGMELFYAVGPAVITYLKEQGLKVFLDLKVHDIPNTAYGAVKSLLKLRVDMINVHANGSVAMMSAAHKAVDEFVAENNIEAPLLIGVTQLTSIDQETQNNELGISGTVADAVMRLGKNAKQAKLDGVVCSAHEAKLLKDQLGPEFITVCPGIRPASSNSDDQKRITTPREAFNNQADFIVIGRAITEAKSPAKAFLEIVQAIQ